MRDRFAGATALVVLAVPLLLLAALVEPAFGQRNQPIYPAYDGFVKNPDGSYTLAFAYFNGNAEVITIPAGPDNSFSPAAVDRLQPTTFNPGHWRFQCVMVVGPEFDGKLTWTLSYAGTTTGTSQHMLQSSWNLVEGAAELKAIEYAKVPRGVCLNRPPTVRILGLPPRGKDAPPPVLAASTSEPLNLFGSVHDEGLPRGRELVVAWKTMNGPGSVTFSNPNAARTRASFNAPGTYELELSATDSEFSLSVRVQVNVTAANR